jgi:hypothetical protein
VTAVRTEGRAGEVATDRAHPALPPPSRSVPITYALVALGIAATLGVVSAAGVHFTTGTATEGSGWGGSESSLPGWSWDGVTIQAITSALSTAGENPNVPISLPATGPATAFGLNTTVKGHLGAYFFSELNGTLPASTEFALNLTIALGGGPVTYSVYFETPVGGITAPYTLTLVWDTGSATAPAKLTLGSYAIDVDACVSLGNCP